MPYDQSFTIEENTKVNAKYYRLTFRAAHLSEAVEPGQFLTLQINPSLDPFWRRPFSYYRIQKDRIQILYEVLGRGTAMLSRKKKGDTVQVMGPLGRPFSPKVKNKKRVLVAGGVGVPPLIFLAEKYAADYLLIGTKSSAEVLPKKELAKIKAEILYSTNDGSYGSKGFVTKLLEQVIKKELPENIFIQTCGPNIMMEAVMKMALQWGIEGELSVDKPMACGVGACLGCMVKTSDGWKASCVEGPVFNFKDIDLATTLS
ncbi:MAG: dihydroorotate dehydrogenase electron transfer subunit [Candidatus Omnitrophica bacterium]|nr:dihydroorotate dehydrogenase electron transfer subunit [Candidatus Omnitrophota bacterium]